MNSPSPSNQKYDFSGKVALITGSSMGIGAAIAIQLARYGARVCITGLEGEDLDRVGHKVEKASGLKALQVFGNLLDREFAPFLMEQTIRIFGRLDVLVNNAGTGSPNDTFDNPNLLKQFDEVMNLNVRAALQLTHLATPYLEQTRGCVVNMGSFSSFKPVSCVFNCRDPTLGRLGTQRCAFGLNFLPLYPMFTIF